MWYQKKVPLVLVLIVSLLATMAILSNRQPGGNTDTKLDYTKLLLAKWAGIQVPQNAPTTTKCGTGCDRVFKDVFSSLTSSYRNCLLEKLEGKKVWTELKMAVSICLGDALWRLLDAKKFENRDDIKLAILPPTDIPASEEFGNCTEITLGIGRDIESELLLRKAQPHCKFHGADPIKESGKVFHELGPYFELAVATEKGYIMAEVLENGKYQSKNVSAITFVDFVLNYVNTTKVDFLLMDNEGPEYKLMRQFLKGGPIEANNISVCQMSIEFHYPLTSYGMDDDKYNKLIRDLLTNSSLVPIWLSMAGHTRSFFVNIGDPYCVGKYFRSKWCGEFQYYT